ncbi:hypothetical protein [Bordetella genomosp. 2]|uniref:Uncharacterized protein n=1 Tax=Bordetella genomosp. 2 TaxID=1983456 RepID=A0A261W3I9_9BORD|nr:hypothetical protein [Bordetella genomosp. 2]OZI80143.1 hypothetical protein CAL24_08455 [Bordetella genomosp. 2]
MLTTLLSSFGGYIVAAVVALVAVAGAYLRGRSSGKGAERTERDAKINEQAAQARQEVQEVRNETASMADDAIADYLESDWVRKPTGKGRR